MIVILTRAVPERLRGYLARYLVEVRAGVFVGEYSTDTRETLWDTVCDEVGSGNAVIVWSTNTESGFDFETIGKHPRTPTEKHGLKLVNFTAKEIMENWEDSLDDD